MTSEFKVGVGVALFIAFFVSMVGLAVHDEHQENAWCISQNEVMVSLDGGNYCANLTELTPVDK